MLQTAPTTRPKPRRAKLRPVPLAPRQARTAAALGHLAHALERRSWLAIASLTLLYLAAALQGSRTKPLWHDELFTFYIAQAPTLGKMWSELRTLDLNPPLTVLLTRLSFHLFGVSTLAARLPEIAGFLLFLLATFHLVRRRMGVLFALAAAALLLESKVFPLAFEARPYALLLGFLALAFAAWQAAAESPGSTNLPSRRISLTLLFLSTLAMLLCHVFALLPVAALLAAEMHRTRRNTLVDLPVLLALALPLLATLSYIPLLHNHASAIYPEALQPDGNTIFEFYVGSFDRQLVTLALTALAVLLVMGRAHLQPAAPSRPPFWFFSAPEWTAIIALLVSPLLLLMLFLRTHAAFFERYGVVESLGVTLLIAALLARWTMNHDSVHSHPDPRAALIAAAIALLISGAPAALLTQIRAGTLLRVVRNSEPILKPCDACLQAAALNPSLPLVDASGLTFLEMNHNESSAILDHLFYLTDTRASTRLAHASIFENMPDEISAFHLRGHSLPYRDFLRGHPRFFVLGKYDYPEDWLLRQLQADGASIRVLGRTDDSYRDKELYEVTVAPSP